AITTVDASVALNADNSIAITTPRLNLNALAMINTSGTTSTIKVVSPVGSDLTIQLPAGGSTATLQTTWSQQHSNPNRPAMGFVNLPGTLPAGSISFIPDASGSGHALSFVNPDQDPQHNQATLVCNGLLVTSTISNPTTVGTGVTLASNSPIAILVKDTTLFNNGLITSSAPAAQGYNSWRTINISGNNGALTLDGIGGTLSVTGIASPTIPQGPAGPVIIIGPSTFNTTINQSFTANLTSLGFMIINTQFGCSVTLAPGVKVDVKGGGLLPSGTVPAGNFVYAPVTLAAATINLGAGSSVVSDRTS